MTRYLKKTRYVCAIVVILLFSAVFLDLHGLMNTRAVSAIVFFQVIPSFLKVLSGAGGILSGLLIILLMTFFLGRIYCSFLCPLGIFKDCTSRAAAIKSKQKKRYSKPHNLLRYSILVLTFGLFFSGSMVLINILDPYSNFGRIVTILAKPVAGVINNMVSRILEMMDMYLVMPYDQAGVSIPVLIFVAVYTIGIIILAVRKGRLYCNTLCPVGSFLGLISSVSLFRLNIDPSSCTGCGKCERTCKSSCIDHKEKKIDFSRCVTCYTCIDICPEKSIAYRLNPRFFLVRRSSGELNNGRRLFMMMVALTATGIAKAAFAVNRPVVYVKNKIVVKRQYPITPPGSLSIEHFTERCTACYLCVTTCPGKVIQPVFSGYDGKKGILMPAMQNKHGYCNYKCTRCGEVCPTGAILPLSTERKKETQVGKVVFIRENCIVITQKTECGACSEHCPTKAVYMVVENGLRVPAIRPEICIGCGACEYACPSIPNKSIYVEGNPIHLKAEQPKTEKQKAPPSDQPFPF